MKKIFQVIGLISLICFSFFITDKTAKVASNMDDIMVDIKANYKKYNSKSIDATIENNTIIPGKYGKEVNINKSYKNMKQNGYYNENLYIYDYIKPKISIEDNKDKYIISGYKKKRIVSLIFLVRNDDNINNIISILERNDIKGNFFIDDNFLLKNNNLVIELINNKHIVGNLGKNMSYSNSSFNWIDTVIKKVGKQQNGYCYSIVDNEDNLNECVLAGDYTVRPNIIVSRKPLVEIKNKLTSGSIIAIDVNSNIELELSSIIKYIKSKGYEISNLEEQLSEK